MLTAIVNAFLHGAGRDLFLVPVSISYERLVEEVAYKRELLGAEKEKETLVALLRARTVLKRNYGKAYVAFGEPLSLAAALGDLKRAFAADTPEAEEEKRRFILRLGFRLLGEVNRVSVVTAPSVAATVLLANPHPAVRTTDFLVAAGSLLDHASGNGARFTRSLERDRSTFAETLQLLEASGLVVSMADGDGAVLHVPDDKRLNLDFYKNNTIHLFVLSGLLAHALLRGVPRDRMKEDVWWWLDLFRNEFVLPGRESLAAAVSPILDRLDRLETGGATDAFFAVQASILQNFREAYWIALKALAALPEEGLAEEDLLEEMRRLYRVNLLLGVLRKPEGNTSVTLTNAMNRFGEMGYVGIGKKGRRGRWIERGDVFPAIVESERRVRSAMAAAAPRIGA
jgi:glycerol-3-phosphate O-acyltransferase